MNKDPGLFSRLIRFVVTLCIVSGGVFTINNTIGLENMMNAGSEAVTNGFDGVSDAFGPSPVEGEGVRPYADTNKDSLKTLENNIGEFSNEKGYERSLFGDGWNNVGNKNSVGWEKFTPESCNVRKAVLIEQGENVEYDKTCDISGGTWTDPYGERNGGGKVEYHTSTTARDFDIDHVVALSLAWRSGASYLDDDLRNQIANDKANLLISEAGINRSKGDQDIVDWTPPVDSGSYCDYADRYAHVKAKYDLTVTQSEYDKLKEVIDSCNA